MFATSRHREELACAAGGSCSTDGAQGGRPKLPQNEVDEELFALYVFEGYTADDLMEEFGLSSVNIVYKLKQKLGLTFLGTGGQRPSLPTLEELEMIWESNPLTRTIDLAAQLVLSLRTLQLHSRPAAAHAVVGPGECATIVFGVMRRGCRVSPPPPPWSSACCCRELKAPRQGLDAVWLPPPSV